MKRKKSTTAITEIDAKAYEIINNLPLVEKSQRSCRNAWDEWSAFCQRQNVSPDQATSHQMDTFIEGVAGENPKAKRRLLFHVYQGFGRENPAARKPIIRAQKRTARLRTESYWNSWISWCKNEGAPHLPADPEKLIEYLSEVAEKQGLRQSTHAIEAIMRRHQETKAGNPRVNKSVDEAVRSLIKAEAENKNKAKKPRPDNPRPKAERRRQYAVKGWENWCIQHGLSPTQPSGTTALSYLKEAKSKWTGTYSKHVMTTLSQHYGYPPDTTSPFLNDGILEEIKERLIRDEDRPIAKPERSEAPGDPLLANNTRQNDLGTWRAWAKWCAENQVDVMDATPRHVIAYITDFAKTRKLSTVEKAFYGLIHQYDWRTRKTVNPANSDLVRGWLRMLRKQLGTRSSKVKGVRREDYEEIKATALRQRSWETEKEALVRGTKTIAALGLQRDALLRVGELAAVTWQDITHYPDGSGRLLIRRSKTDQLGKGTTRYIRRETMLWLKRLRHLLVSGDTVFELQVHSLRVMIKEATAQAGLEGRYSGHSARVGMAQDLAARRFSMTQIMHAGRWRSPEMATDYIRDITEEDSPVAMMEREEEAGTARSGPPSILRGYARRTPVVVVVIRNIGDYKKYQ